MSNVTNPGHATIAGGTVYYLYAAPTAKADLKHELEVLQTFLAQWNANAGVCQLSYSIRSRSSPGRIIRTPRSSRRTPKRLPRRLVFS